MKQFVKLCLVVVVVIFAQSVRANDECLSDKQVIGSNVMLEGGPGMQHLPFAVYNPRSNQYLLSWAVIEQDEQTVWVQMFDANASAVSSPLNLYRGSADVGPFEKRPDAVYNSSRDEFLVTWPVYDRSGGCQRATRRGLIVSSSGEPKGQSFELLRQNCSDRANSYYEQHQLIYNPVPNEYVVLYSNQPDSRLYALRLNAAGVPMASPVVLNHPHHGDVSNASIRRDTETNRYVATWDLRNALPQLNHSVRAQILSAGLSKIGENLNLTSQNAATRSKLLYLQRENRFVSIWQSCNNHCMKARKLNSNGIVGREFDVRIAGFLDDAKPNPISQGFILVLRSPQGAVHLARLRGDFSFISEANLTCDDQTYPGFLVYNSNLREYLAVWSYYEDDASEKDIFAQRVRAVPLQ